MEKLKYHHKKCRFCIEPLKFASKNVEISEELRQKFINLVGIELRKSRNYSNTVCEVCNNKFNFFLDFIKTLFENQVELYEFVGDEDEDNDRKGIFFDSSVKPEEIVIKVEKSEESCVKTQEKFKPAEKPAKPAESSSEWMKRPCEVCSIILSSEIHHKQHVWMHSKQKNSQNLVKKSPVVRKTRNPTNSRVFNPPRNRQSQTPFICDYCDFSTPIKSNLHYHLINHLKKSAVKTFEEFKCPDCPKIFYQKRFLTAHARTHSVPPLTCEYCGKEFKTLDSLRSHKHDFHDQNQLSCQDCGQVYTAKSTLRRHFESVHAPKICCELCGQLVAPGEALRSHMRRHAPRLKCTVEGCTKDFGDREGLAYHKEAVHGPSLNLKCASCGKEFQNLRKLRKHERRQHEAVEVSCPIQGCKHKSKRRAYMVMHFKNHREIDDDYRNELLNYLKTIKMSS